MTEVDRQGDLILQDLVATFGDKITAVEITRKIGGVEVRVRADVLSLRDVRGADVQSDRIEFSYSNLTPVSQ